MPAIAVEGVGTCAMTKIGSGQRDSEQGFLEGGRLTVMDSDRRLHCLSLNMALRFATMSFSSSSLLEMGDTTGSTPISDSMLAVEEDEDRKEDEAKGEEGDANHEVRAF